MTSLKRGYGVPTWFRPLMTKYNTYRNGKIHVMAEMCSTCIFRPHNQMDLVPGRVRQMIDEAKETESYIPCHTTIPIAGGDNTAVCRGFFDKHPTPPLMLAKDMGIIEYDEPKELT